ncbi:MAG TPA: phosphodiester glycosidase family protein [Acidimicrobiales bacterium]|nr:phosphodiester glycosidase family protein [Acidimicrobiales bacterium]
MTANPRAPRTRPSAVEDLHAPRRSGARTHSGRPRPSLIAAHRARRARRRSIRRSRKSIVGRHPYSSTLAVVLVALTPVWISLGSALGNPGFGTSESARFAEWARQHGMGPIVVRAENLWFTHHQPPIGGKPLKGAIPSSSSGLTVKASGSRAAFGLPVPKAIAPLASPPIPGEGVWHPAGRLVNGFPAVYEAYLRPDPVHTSLVVGVAWMDTKLTRATLYSGSTIPGGGPFPMTAPVTHGAATSLIAAFNAGFLVKDSKGGYYTDGRTIVPLRQGAATFVIYRDGTATVAQWGRDAAMSSKVVAARQNLDLLVDGGKPVPGLNATDTSKWGFTLGNQIFVWRSGVGVTADGALVYVGGPGLNITTLANLLVRAGAVRAMELDINTDWVNFATYSPTAPLGVASPNNGTDLLSSMAATPQRYFEPWWGRDFFTMSARPRRASA